MISVKKLVKGGKKEEREGEKRGRRPNKTTQAQSVWLAWTRSIYHLGCREEILDVTVCGKGHRFMQASIVFVNLSLVSKVKGG